MADLVVRNLERSLVEALKKRASRHGRSAEAEHRAILEAALARTRRKTFAQALARAFFGRVAADQTPVFLSVVTVGELRRGGGVDSPSWRLDTGEPT